MSLISSGPELIELAIRTEKNGQKFYAEQAEKTRVEGIKSLFNYLSSEEKKHIEDFNNLYDIIKKTGERMFGDYEEFKSYMQSFLDSKFLTNFVSEAANIKDSADVKQIIDFAIAFEKETLLFYYGIKDYISEQGRQIIENIVEQEKSHIRKLTGIKDTLK